MAIELNLENLEGMGKADYIKAFKNKAVWKKAKAVIFMVDYKLDGKKTVIALPFKKESEMKVKMKEIKKNKTHFLKKTGAGTINVENDGPEGLKAKVELIYGGLNPILLQDKALELFGRINATLEVKISENAELEGEEAESDASDNVKPALETEAAPKPTAQADDEQPTEDKNKEIKLTIAKIAKLNKAINLKDGLQDSDVKYAEALKKTIRDFANLLKAADSDTRSEFGETFIKIKKLYAKLEEELKKLKESKSAFEAELEQELNDVLGEHSGAVEAEEEANAQSDDDDDEEAAPTDKKEAIEKNKELMEEINDLMKSVNLYALS
jgi:hypothetical protein